MGWLAFGIIVGICWFVGSCFNKLDKILVERIDSIRKEMEGIKELCEYLRDERNNYMDEAAAWKKDCLYFQGECTKLDKKLKNYEKKSGKTKKTS